MIKSKLVNWKEVSGGYWLTGFLSTNTTSTIIVAIFFKINLHTGTPKLQCSTSE